MSDKIIPQATALGQVAFSQDGLFTSSQARANGYSAQLLKYHADAGRFNRIGRGIYEISGFPAGPNRHIRELWMQFGKDRAIVSHESALVVHGATDLIPSGVHLTVERRHRGRRPSSAVVLHTTKMPLDAIAATTVQGIRVTTIERTILDCVKSRLPHDELVHAITVSISSGMTSGAMLTYDAQTSSSHVQRRLQELIRRADPRYGS